MRQKRVIFADIDGVFNRKELQPSGLYGLAPDLIVKFNDLIERAKDTDFVLSSTWRYRVHAGDMTVAGLEYLLRVMGVNIGGRLAGVTPYSNPALLAEFQKGVPMPDLCNAEDCKAADRAREIQAYLAENPYDIWVALDDTRLPVDVQVQPNTFEGITDKHVDEILQKLGLGVDKASELVLQ